MVEEQRMGTEEPIFGDTERADIDCDWRRRTVGKSDERNGWSWRGERMWDGSARVGGKMITIDMSDGSSRGGEEGWREGRGRGQLN